jgi:indolepyruvate ferredoxin oxidoreductase beta subunit
MKALYCEPLDIVITGVGGQGNVLASQVLGRALLRAGYTVTVGETYGMSQRGGAVMSQVRVTNGQVMGPLMPENRATAIVSLEPLEALRVLGQYGHPGVVVLTNDRPLTPLNVQIGQDRYPEMGQLRQAIAGLCGRLYWLPATEAAFALGSPILANVVMLGALLACGLLPLEPGQVEEVLSGMFPESKMAANRLALAKGQEMAAAVG